MIPSAPVSVSSPGQTVSVSVPTPSPGGGDFVAAVINNVSPYAITVSATGGQYNQWIMPYEADMVPLGFGESGSITATTTQLSTTPLALFLGQIFVTWYSANDVAERDTYPVSLPAQALLGGANPTQVDFGSFAYTASGLSNTFAPPINSPAISELMIGYTQPPGGPGAVNILVTGHNSSIIYFPRQGLQAGSYITFPVSEIFDPGGFDVNVTNIAGVFSTVNIHVIGLTTPVLPAAGALGGQQINTPGPTGYATNGIVGAGNATLIGAGSARSTIRVWAMWVTCDNRGAAAASEADINVVGGAVLLSAAAAVTVAGATGFSASNSLSIPGGMPIFTGANVIQITNGTAGLGRAGIAYSVDIP